MDETQIDTLASILEAFSVQYGTLWTDRLGVALQEWSKKVVKSPIRTLSLFTGAGGLDIGFHDVGFTIVQMLDSDVSAVRTLEANIGDKKYFKNASVLCRDIKKYHPSSNLKIDFIIGGPPCQPFSAAGRRVAGVQGTKSHLGSLFREYVRILKRLSPKGFLFENVDGIIGAEDGKAWRKIRSAFARAGYEVFYRVLDAADYGVPQHRKRVFIVGTNKKKYFFPKPFFGQNSSKKQSFPSAKAAIKGVRPTLSERKSKVNGRYGNLLLDIPPGLNYKFYTLRMGHPKPVFAWRSKFYDFLYKADPDLPIRTLTAHAGQYSGPFHWNNRRFATAELKRLQTIPDEYTITGSPQSARKQIGNSVPPQISRILALSILNQIFDIPLPFNLPVYEDNQTTSIQKNRVPNQIHIRRVKNAIIRAKKTQQNCRVRARKFTAVMDEKFSFKTAKNAKQLIYVEFKPTNDKWHFAVSNTPTVMEPKFFLHINTVKGKEWNLKVEEIVLTGTELTPQLFTASWKSLEYELRRKNLKADLIQLCGYFNYSPSFQSELYISGSRLVAKKWKIVQYVVKGIGVGKIISRQDLSNLWNVSEQRVLYYASFLKAIGYEVRNENTNPQIPKSCYFIPYSFPTLGPLNPQMYKPL